MFSIPNYKPLPNSEENLSFVIVSDEKFPLKKIATNLPGIFSPERWELANL